MTNKLQTRITGLTADNKDIFTNLCVLVVRDLLDGKKMRSKAWHKDHHMYIRDNNLFFSYGADYRSMLNNPHSVEFMDIDGWEEYKDGKLSFREALKLATLERKRIRAVHWPSDFFIYETGRQGEVSTWKNQDHKEAFIFQRDKEKDWEEYKPL